MFIFINLNLKSQTAWRLTLTCPTLFSWSEFLTVMLVVPMAPVTPGKSVFFLKLSAMYESSLFPGQQMTYEDNLQNTLHMDIEIVVRELIYVLNLSTGNKLPCVP